MGESHVYDKAKYHRGDAAQYGLGERHAAHHIAYFVRWLLERGLFSPERIAGGDVPRVDGRVDGTRLLDWFSREMDDCLLDEALSEEGDRFARDYYEERYLVDYVGVLAANLESAYHVAWSEENWQRIAVVLDRRHAEFLKPKRRWWPFGGR